MSEETTENVTPEITQQTLDSIELLRDLVKHSHLDNQKHVDLGLVSVDERPKYEKALILLNHAIKEGQLSQDEANSRLGLK